MKVIVAGGRDFTDWEHTCLALDKITTGMKDLIIVSGTARGADAQGERYAEDVGCEVVRFPADWDQYGLRAGYLRNEAMAEYADVLVAFWDGHSRGTGHMIDLAHQRGLEVYVFFYVPLDRSGS